MGELGRKGVTFGRGVGLGSVGVESTGHAGNFAFLVDDGIVVDLLLEVLELPCDGSAGPGPFEVLVGLKTGISLLELNSVTIGPAAHVEDINKIIPSSQQLA